MCYSEQLGTLFAAYEDGHVRGWDIETGQQNVCGCGCGCTSDNMYCISGICVGDSTRYYTRSVLMYVRMYINVRT